MTSASIVVDNGNTWIEFHHSAAVSTAIAAVRDVTFTVLRSGDLLWCAPHCRSVNHQNVALGNVYVNGGGDSDVGVHVLTIRVTAQNISTVSATSLAVGVVLCMRRSHS